MALEGWVNGMTSRMAAYKLNVVNFVFRIIFKAYWPLRRDEFLAKLFSSQRLRQCQVYSHSSNSSTVECKWMRNKLCQFSNTNTGGHGPFSLSFPIPSSLLCWSSSQNHGQSARFSRVVVLHDLSLCDCSFNINPFLHDFQRFPIFIGFFTSALSALLVGLLRSAAVSRFWAYARVSEM